ncbi:hypothetical protein PRZ48_004589 [Zasmidium cellare]|uniref:Beta-glucuronidase C-terminal domain-containing protein n=1 Tax=Zasmidium cellare TaxID=395010 RepID=A0ABR0EPZ6_ZASCE|nr:hypothetical protein PRZ48_004589 [Zasmidium cellare]
MWSALVLLPIGATLTHQSPLSLDLQRDSLALTVPTTAPSGTSNVVDKSYPGLAFSQHSFQEYAGNKSSPNTFSANLIKAISDRTGTALHIRVGGTSGDFSTFDPNQKESIVFPPGYKPGGIPKGMKLGPTWYEGFTSFPGVRYTYMTHLANTSDGQKANSVAGTKEALKNIGSNLEAIEIGNEINFYPNVNRNGSYSVVNYLNEWHDYQEAIDAAVGAQKYQAPVYFGNNCPWCIANTFQRGQNSKNNVVSAALHHYMDGSNVPVTALQSNYMNHTRIANQLDPFKTPVAWLAQNAPSVNLDLAEDNSNTYSTNNYDVLGVFGSTLWLADYLLYGTTLGIRRMNIQQSTGFSYASWRGVDYNGLPAAVLPPYYAHPFVADVLGKTGSTRVANIATGRDTFSAYGIYDGSTLKRIVLINFREYNSATTSTRPSTTASLSSGSYNGKITIERLTAPDAHVQDASKISWKGLSWTKASNGQSYSSASTTGSTTSRSGKFSVEVKDSEAVLLTLG